MQVKYVLYVICCAVPLLLHMADSQEYRKFNGDENKKVYCAPEDTNCIFDYVLRISGRIKYIDLTEQPLKQLPHNAFGNISSQNELTEIILARCEIQHIDVDAFVNLDNLEILHMDSNSISRFETGTFQHTKKLKKFKMSYNKIEILQTGLFHNLIHLQEVDFSFNSITCIEQDTFRNTPSLTRINVLHNKLEYLSPLFTDTLISVSNVLVGDNPWNCDCNLREFYEKYKKPVYEDTEPICQNPPGLRGRTWTDLTSDEFTCDARIIFPKNDTRVVTLGSNVTLSCEVLAHPAPGIEWHRNTKIIAQHNVLKSTFTNTNMHYLNYTFTVQEKDLGEYYCFAVNSANVEEASLTLTMNGTTK